MTSQIENELKWLNEEGNIIQEMSSIREVDASVTLSVSRRTDEDSVLGSSSRLLSTRLKRGQMKGLPHINTKSINNQMHEDFENQICQDQGDRQFLVLKPITPTIRVERMDLQMSKTKPVLSPMLPTMSLSKLNQREEQSYNSNIINPTTQHKTPNEQEQIVPPILTQSQNMDFLTSKANPKRKHIDRTPKVQRNEMNADLEEGKHFIQRAASQNVAPFLYSITPKSFVKQLDSRINNNSQGHFKDAFSKKFNDAIRGSPSSGMKSMRRTSTTPSQALESFSGSPTKGLRQEQDIQSVTNNNILTKRTNVSNGSQRRHINEHIENMNVEQRNRNTRFFKSYLKDQYKAKQVQEKRQKSSRGLDKLPGLVKEDSLTVKIRGMTNQPLRRQEQKGEIAQSNGNMDKKLQAIIQNKMLKTIIKQKKDKKEEIDQHISGVDSFRLTTKTLEEGEEENSVNNLKLQRKNQHVEQQSMLMAQANYDDDDDDITISEEEIKRINQLRIRAFMILYPDSTFRTLVDAITFLLILSISLYIPYVFSFDVATTGSLNHFEVFLDIWFIFEIILNFFTGYYQKGILVMDRKQIAMNYIKQWFFVDVISSFPYSFMDLANDSTGGGMTALKSARLIRVLRMAKYARLLRIVRFLKVNRLITSLEELIVSESVNLVLGFVKLSIVLFFITHWMACIFYSIGSNGLQNDHMNWINQSKLQDASNAERYVNSLYWAFTTMTSVGYGDIHPYTSKERLIAMMSMIVSSGVFAFIIGNIGRIVSSFNVLAAQFRERMLYVEQFLRQKEIPAALRLQVKRYLEYNWELKKLYKIEEQELLNLLNENLKGKITVYLNGKILQNIYVLSQFPIEFLSNVSFILKKKTYSTEDNLVLEGEHGSDIFFIVSGKVAIIHKKTMTHIKDLEKDSHFGEIAFFSCFPRQTSVKARDFTDVLTIERNDFLQMAEKIESQQTLILYHKIKDSVEENEEKKDYRKLGVKCYICDKVGHISIDCIQFSKTLKGNLSKYLKKVRIGLKTSDADLDFYDTDQKSPHPILNTMQTRKGIQNNNGFNQQSKSSTLALSKFRTQFTSAVKRSNFQNESCDNNFLKDLSVRHSQNSFSNLIALPRDQMDKITLQEHSDFDDEQQELDCAFKELQNNISLVSQLSLLDKSNSLDQSLSSNFERLPSLKKKESRTSDPNYNDNIRVSQFDQVKKKRLKQGTSSNIPQEVIQEEDEEEKEDEQDKQSKYKDSKRVPLLKQYQNMTFGRAPKSQNELTRMVGRKKKFGSKNFRQQYKDNQDQNQQPRRSISINQIGGIKNKVKTVVEQTYTTFVHTFTSKCVEYEEALKKSSTQKYKSQRSNILNKSKNEDLKKKDSFYMSMFNEDEGQEDLRSRLISKNKSYMNDSNSENNTVDDLIKQAQGSKNMSTKKNSNQQQNNKQYDNSLTISISKESSDNPGEEYKHKNKQESKSNYQHQHSHKQQDRDDLAQNSKVNINFNSNQFTKLKKENEFSKKVFVNDNNTNQQYMYEDQEKSKDQWNDYQEMEGSIKFAFNNQIPKSDNSQREEFKKSQSQQQKQDKFSKSNTSYSIDKSFISEDEDILAFQKEIDNTDYLVSAIKPISRKQSKGSSVGK